MKTINYTPDLTGLNIIKDYIQQNDLLFYKGHPDFLIPDFNSEPCDLWLSFLDYVESTLGIEIFDQNGGAITEHIVAASGKTSITYTFYDLQLEEDSDMKDYIIEMEGYVIDSADNVYFLATKVIIPELK